MLFINKPNGMTPLEVVNKIKTQNLELINKKITYAGRLDPLAHGLLLLLVGEETKNRNAYLSLRKIYEFEMILGFETDTYDILGYLKKQKSNNPQ